MTKFRCDECGKKLAKSTSLRVTKKKRDDLKSVKVMRICKDCAILLGLGDKYIITALD